jgi:thiamine biosynthesis lipoprotein
VIVWGATPWRVGVRDPRAPDRLLGVVLLQNGVVASSGDYERFSDAGGKRRHHIIDPRTGESTTGPRGVTLVAESVDQLNGLSAAIMVMGSARGRALIHNTPGVAGLIVERDGTVWISEQLRARFVATTE